MTAKGNISVDVMAWPVSLWVRSAPEFAPILRSSLRYSAQIKYLLLACGGAVLAPKVERPGVVVISPRGGAAARQVLSSSGSRAQAVQAGTLFFSPSNFNLTRSDKI